MMNSDVAAYELRACMRVINHDAWVLREVRDDTWMVSSATLEGRFYNLAVYRNGDNLLIRCTCPSGKYRRHLPIPCKHAALVAADLLLSV